MRSLLIYIYTFVGSQKKYFINKNLVLIIMLRHLFNAQLQHALLNIIVFFF